MPRKLFSNNAVTTLAANASSGTTSLSVASSSLFPAPSAGDSFNATLQHIVSGVVTVDEIVEVTAVSGTTWTVVRAQEGTGAVAWVAGDTVALLPTAGDLEAFLQAEDLQAQSNNYAADTGAANAYIASLTPALTAHSVGTPIVWRAANTNTGASTFSDGFGVGSLETPARAALSANMVEAGGMYLTYWNGAVFILANPDWAASIAAAAAAAQAAAEAFAEDGSNISSGTVPAAHLPLIGDLDGITLAADPGTTPSGSPGDWFLYY